MCFLCIRKFIFSVYIVQCILYTKTFITVAELMINVQNQVIYSYNFTIFQSKFDEKFILTFDNFDWIGIDWQGFSLHSYWVLCVAFKWVWATKNTAKQSYRFVIDINRNIELFNCFAAFADFAALLAFQTTNALKQLWGKEIARIIMLNFVIMAIFSEVLHPRSHDISLQWLLYCCFWCIRHMQVHDLLQRN